MFFTKQGWFEHGEKAGKLLAFLAQTENKPPIVISLHEWGGTTITDPSAVASKFRDFFEELYSLKVPEDTTSMEHFFEGVSLPHLSESQVELLEAPLRVEEIVIAIAEFARSKYLLNSTPISLRHSHLNYL